MRPRLSRFAVVLFATTAATSAARAQTSDGDVTNGKGNQVFES
jgi:hypothetical protein